MRSHAQRIARALLGLAGIVAFGTAGYVVIADYPPLDALYMTVTTIATVGYGEIRPLSPAGRIFTMVLILGSAGVTLYLLGQLAQALVETSLRAVLQRRAMERKIEALSGHVIVCGYGRLGRIVVDELTRANAPLVIVESDSAKEPDLLRSGHPFLIGSAALDEVLLHAGVCRARAIVVATGSDADNVYITLTARELSPSLEIHARGESDAALRRLIQAGATRAVSAHQLGGIRLASGLLRPSVVEFVEITHPRVGEQVDLEELRIAEGSRSVGLSVRALERSAPRLRVVGLKRGDARMQLVPDEDLPLLAGDLLVVIGERESLEQIAQIAAPD
ncbi:MAG: potassium channel family protein [Myxococcota bacterium]